MAMEEVTQRLERIASAFEKEGVPFALVGGQAVALWVATKDPAAVRTTKDVDILLERGDLPKARAAALKVNLEYFETLNVGMFLEKADPNPRNGVHLVWAGEKVMADNPLPSPTLKDRLYLELSKPVVTLAGLVCMKLMANRDQDRVHLRDLVAVELVDRALLKDLPDELTNRLEALLQEAGR
jgi:hypothetical protein